MKKSNYLPVVLFVPSSDANRREMAIVARYLKLNEFAKPIFFPEKIRDLDSWQDEFTVIKNLFDPIKVYDYLVDIVHKIAFFKRKHNLNKYLLSFKLGIRLKQTIRILKKISPISIVLRGDRHLGNGWEPAFIRAGKILNIPTIVLTFSYTSNPETLLKRRRNKKQLNADEDNFAKKKYPNQFYFDKKTGSNILYRPRYALEALNDWIMLPRYPWVMGGGNSDYILVAGKNTKERLIKLGCYEKKIRITGLAVHDDLYINHINKIIIKQRLFEKYNFIDSKPLIILSPAQLYEEKFVELNTARQELEKLIFLCSNIDANVLISLHPRMNKKLYLESISKFDIPVADENLFEIIVSADIFSSSYSSTVEWAVICGVPAVIYDFYQLNYSRYNDYKGVVVNKDRTSYLNYLNELIANKEKLRLMSEKQLAKARELSPFDGCCLERISQIIINKKLVYN